MSTSYLISDQIVANLTIDPGDVLVTDGWDLTVTGNLVVNGTLDATPGSGGSSSLTVYGDATFQPGSLPVKIPVSFAGTAAQSFTSGGNAFGPLHALKTGSNWLTMADATTADSFDAVPAAKIQFAAGALFTFTLFLPTGSVGQRILLRSTIPGSQWFLQAGGLPLAQFVDVQDSDANPGSLITADDGTNVDSGNNENWFFGVPVGTIIFTTNRLVAGDLVVMAGDTLITQGYDLVVNGNLYINGTLNVTPGVGGSTHLTVFGNVIFQPGSLVGPKIPVRFEGGQDQSFLSGGHAFSLLDLAKTDGWLTFGEGVAADVFTVGPSQKVRFQAGALFDFGSFLPTGAPFRLILFRSTTSGANWFLKAHGFPHAHFVDVRDSDARSGQLIMADDGTNFDAGNDFNWFFGVRVGRTPFEEIYDRRYGVLSANTTIGGLPHRWLELYGGRTVPMVMSEPDPATFRDDWYYHTIRNQLYKRVGQPRRWLLASEVVLSDDGMKL